MRPALFQGVLAFTVLASCLHTRDALSQVITGDLIGWVSDESGAVLPGALVRLSSPALLGGSAEQITNEKGQFRFLRLFPGLYDLEVSLSGFSPYRQEAISVEVGRAVEVRVGLRLARVVESVVVTGESPLVDTRRSGLSTVYDASFVRNIPTRRFSTFDFIKLAPGVSATSPSKSWSAVSVFGSGINENLFLIDGTNFT